MEFGIQIEPQFGFEYDEVLEISNSALQNGFSTIWFSDHFMLDKDATDRVLLDPWLLMTALVRDNLEIRVGSLVFCNSYRNPALTAKLAATLARISDGRFEFGYGAGWKEIEYDAYGIEFPSDNVRIDQLSEALEIIRGIWSEEKFSFTGEHYNVKEIVSYPKPDLEKMRIWIGTMKAKDRMLEVAAKYGDGINVAWSYSAEQCQEIFKKLDDFGELYGRERGTIKRSVGFWTRCFETEDELVSAVLKNAAKLGIGVDEYKKRIDSALWGTPDILIEKLQRYEELDVSHAIFMLPHGNEIDQAKMIGSKVIPYL